MTGDSQFRAMSMPSRASLIGAWTAILIGLVVYAIGIGSHHQPTNPDELLYVQITRATAASGHLLPLQSMSDDVRNTKPPLLFWQGVFATDWGREWSLLRVRLPSLLYTMATAALLVLVGLRRLRSLQIGLVAAALFLCFFSTFRYGRVLMTISPETFWLSLPLGLLLIRDKPVLPDGVLWPCLLGAMVGIALLYWSFALVIPVVLTIALWALIARGWRWKEFFCRDAWRIALLAAIALLVFGLWFMLDPHPTQVFSDFVLRENAGKFRTGSGNALWNYMENALWGHWNIWTIVFGYPYHAGLLAPAVVALVAISWLRRKQLDPFEVSLWVWLTVLVFFFCIPNQRYEHYVIPAMPALALLLAIRFDSLPRWILLVSLAAAAVVAAGLVGLGIILQHHVGEGPLYPTCALLFPLAAIAVCAAGFFSAGLTRPVLAPAILLTYLCYPIFLLPLDRGRGVFGTEAIRAVAGKEVYIPADFKPREETYTFLIPGADMKPYKNVKRPPAKPFVIVSLPLEQSPPDGVVLGRRLNMVERFGSKEISDILRGNISDNLFRWEWLVQRP